MFEIVRRWAWSPNPASRALPDEDLQSALTRTTARPPDAVSSRIARARSSAGIAPGSNLTCSRSENGRDRARERSDFGRETTDVIAPGSDLTCSGRETTDVIAPGSDLTCSWRETTDVIAPGSDLTCSRRETTDVIAPGSDLTCSGRETTDVIGIGAMSIQAM
eukprot:365918-Chlamydomonas_euryale.AAC.3